MARADEGRKGASPGDAGEDSRWVRWLFYPAAGSLRVLPTAVRVANFALALVLIAGAVCVPFTLLTTSWNWAAVYPYREKFYQGFALTIVLSLASLLLSTVFGLLSALIGRSRFLPLRYANRIYVDLVRGTPLLVQILVFFYVIAPAFHVDDRNVCGVLILSLSYAAYISEVIRAGIESVGQSQRESARAIGLTTGQTYRYVIFPQALRQMMPSLAGQLVSLIKDSSLLSVISVSEFTMNAREASNITFSSFECYIPLAIGYLLLTLPISFLTRYLEGRNRFET